MKVPPPRFVVSAIAPDHAAQIFGAYRSKKQAGNALSQLSAKFPSYHGWKLLNWSPARSRSRQPALA